MKNFFKPEDFYIQNMAPTASEAAALANVKLNAAIEIGLKLYAGPDEGTWTTYQNPEDRACGTILFIEPIKKEPHVHKPHLRKFLNETTMFDTWVCDCGVELIADWRAR
jgi:hypothetical protein